MILELTSEQRAFKESIEQFAREIVAPRAAAIDKSGEFPTDVMHAAAGHGLLGVTIPKAWGGAGRDYVSYALAIEAIAKASATVAVSLSVTNSLVAEVIAHAGRDQQRERWLRQARDRRGDRRLRAVGARRRHRRGESADRRPSRRATATASPAARCGSPTPRKPRSRSCSPRTRPGLRGQGVTAFLVPMDTPGITRTARADSLGVRGLGCMDLDLDIAVGDDQVLGHVDQGFRLAMWALQGGRVAIAAQALGIGEAALDEAIAYAKQRQQFGQPIANYQAIQWMLADMATELAAARMLTLKAAAAKDRQEKSTLEASMAKLAASEAAHKAADKAMQILASAGYRRGSVVERLFRDVRATEIYQGTSEAQRMIIAANILANA